MSFFYYIDILLRYNYCVIVRKRGCYKLGMFGRKKIFTSFDESQLNATNIAIILKESLPQHIQNVTDIQILEQVISGDQEILYKDKKFRSDINNKIVENHIQHILSFKTGYGFGEPIQYVQSSRETDDDISEELNVLNVIMRNNEKSTKDIKLANSVYSYGVCPRMILYSKEKEKPFEIYNVSPEEAFVVYSNDYRKEPLMSVYLRVRRNIKDETDELHMEVTTKRMKLRYKLPYSQYFNNKIIDFPMYLPSEEAIKDVNVLGYIPIVEYSFNERRISVTELVLGAQNALNTITSNSLNDLEQFVQSYMVFINAEVDGEKLSKQEGNTILQLKSKDGKQQADVKILTSQLKYTEMNILYEQIYRIMLTNAGVPLLNQGGGGSPTGIAKQTDNGWTMADTKIREDELGFIESDKLLIKHALWILKKKNLIRDLGIGSVEIKFTRNKADNIMTKIQALDIALKFTDVETAFALSGVFSDPGESASRAIDQFGEEYFKTYGSNKKDLDYYLALGTIKPKEINIDEEIDGEDTEEIVEEVAEDIAEQQDSDPSEQGVEV